MDLVSQALELMLSLDHPEAIEMEFDKILAEFLSYSTQIPHSFVKQFMPHQVYSKDWDDLLNYSFIVVLISSGQLNKINRLNLRANPYFDHEHFYQYLGEIKNVRLTNFSATDIDQLLTHCKKLESLELSTFTIDLLTHFENHDLFLKLMEISYKEKPILYPSDAIFHSIFKRYNFEFTTHKDRWLSILRRSGVSVIDEQSNLQIDLSCIPTGSFMMGLDSSQLPEESPQHEVAFTEPLLVSKYLVTKSVISTLNGSISNLSQPLTGVAWLESLLWCNELSTFMGLEPVYIFDETDNIKDLYSFKMNLDASGYRLPFEAEWEYFSQAQVDSEYAGSDEIDEVAWYDQNSEDQLMEVGLKKSNKWSLYDCSGSVYEWCNDIWAQYPSDKKIKQSGIYQYNNRGENEPRVIRGGSYYEDAFYCRVKHRNFQDPNQRSSQTGFRVVRKL